MIVASRDRCWVDDSFCVSIAGDLWCTGARPFICPQGQVRLDWSTCGPPEGPGGAPGVGGAAAAAGGSGDIATGGYVGSGGNAGAGGVTGSGGNAGPFDLGAAYSCSDETCVVGQSFCQLGSCQSIRAQCQEEPTCSCITYYVNCECHEDRGRITVDSCDPI